MILALSALSALLLVWIGWRRPVRVLQTAPSPPIAERLIACAFAPVLLFALAGIFFLVLWLPIAEATLDEKTIGELRLLDARVPALVDAIIQSDALPAWWLCLPLAVLAWVVAARRLQAEPLLMLQQAPPPKRVGLLLRAGLTWPGIASSALALLAAFSLFGAALVARASDVHKELRAAESTFEAGSSNLLNALATEIVAQCLAAMQASAQPPLDGKQVRRSIDAIRAEVERYTNSAPDSNRSSRWLLAALERGHELKGLAEQGRNRAVDGALHKATPPPVEGADLKLSMALRDRLPRRTLDRASKPTAPSIARRASDRKLVAELIADVTAQLQAALEADPVLALFADALQPMIARVLTAYSTPAALEQALERMWLDSEGGELARSANDVKVAVARVDTQAHWSRVSNTDWIALLNESALTIAPRPASPSTDRSAWLSRLSKRRSAGSMPDWTAELPAPTFNKMEELARFFAPMKRPRGLELFRGTLSGPPAGPELVIGESAPVLASVEAVQDEPALTVAEVQRVAAVTEALGLALEASAVRLALINEEGDARENAAVGSALQSSATRLLQTGVLSPPRAVK